MGEQSYDIVIVSLKPIQVKNIDIDVGPHIVSIVSDMHASTIVATQLNGKTEGRNNKFT